MHRGTIVGGGLLAVAAGLLCVIGESLGLDMQHVALLGGALGGVVGLVPDRTPTIRVIGFLAGLFVAWIGFAVRALYLPDTASGRAVATVLVVLACLGIVAATATTPAARLPLWSLLLGAAAMVGAYEETYTADSPAFLSESPTAATTVLLAAGIGFLATSVLGPQITAPGPGDQSVSPPDEPPPPAEDVDVQPADALWEPLPPERWDDPLEHVPPPSRVGPQRTDDYLVEGDRP